MLQNSRTLRRLAADHAALHNELPPNYLFSLDAAVDDLTQLDVLLAGPTHTPFAAGLWKVHLSIPPSYPQQPPTANFRTPIFHPNVDPQTGGVCVETLKRDWDSSYTLTHVLQTICCLLIQPNPDSALNAEAGALIQESYEAYARRAELMTSISAAVPHSMKAAAIEAQHRGQDIAETLTLPEGPVRRRRTIAQARARAAAARSTTPPPLAAPIRRNQQARLQMLAPSTSPQLKPGSEDVFRPATPDQQGDEDTKMTEDDENMTDADQENDIAKSPQKRTPPVLRATPRRPQGNAIPLGELIMDDQYSSEDMEPEYPPSPRKSPSKSPAKTRPYLFQSSTSSRPESSRDAAIRAFNVTPPNVTDKPLADDSPFSPQIAISPRRQRNDLFERQTTRTELLGRSLFGSTTAGQCADSSVFGSCIPAGSPDHERENAERRHAREAKLWSLCGGDIKRWNCGDFNSAPISTRAPRW